MVDQRNDNPNWQLRLRLQAKEEYRKERLRREQ